MKKKYIAIFDTNSLLYEGGDMFFGYREELIKFSRWCEIAIPDMVIKEIDERKKNHLNSQRGKLKNNFFYKEYISAPEFPDNQDIIAALKINEEIKFHTIYLHDKDSAYSRIEALALSKKPPFDPQKDSGFKDAYILCTVLEYVQTQEERENIFFITKDDLLKQAMEREGVLVAKDFGDFLKQTSEKNLEAYQTDYFIKKCRMKLILL